MMTRVKARKAAAQSRARGPSTRSKSAEIAKPDVAVSTDNSSVGHTHEFTSEEIVAVRENLLGWYDENKRELQWRELAQHSDRNVRAYSVLVSEIMLQQTQVSTVKLYYARWVDKWPDVQSLSSATLEEVHTAWAGLGYYSRGRRLHEAACKIVNDLNGNVPDNAKDLEKQLPGVGRYTASAVASIAFNEPVGLVDGNVIRVWTRMRTIGSDTTAQSTMDFLWRLSHALVDPQRPGDFNQAVMELGATICSPKTPNCSKCPVASLCKSYGKAKGMDVGDIEEIGCKLCPPAEEPWHDEVGVMNYPRKGKRTKAKEARNKVCIISRESPTGSLEYLLWQRPATGLLASLWEFPSFSEGAEDGQLEDYVVVDDRAPSKTLPGKHVGDVFHQFSHISQTYSVYRCEAGVDGQVSVGLPPGYQGYRWMTGGEIDSSAVSTAMKKVFRLVGGAGKGEGKRKKRGEKEGLEEGGKKQKTLRDFFAKKE